MSESGLIRYILSEENYKCSLEDAIEEYSDIDDIDMDNLIYQISKSLGIKMPRDSRDRFIEECEKRNWCMTIGQFLDRMRLSAKVYEIDNKKYWEFGKI